MGVGGGISDGVSVLERCCGVCGRGHGSADHRDVVESVRRGQRIASRANIREERNIDILRSLTEESKSKG
jgi:hypothetical protein